MKNTFGAALNGMSGSHRESHVGTISSVGSGGKSISIANMNSSELNLVPITPYGISSSPPPGLMAFALVTDNSSDDGMIGVYDPNKPSCSPGDSILYSSGGATVHCKGDRVFINGIDILKRLGY